MKPSLRSLAGGLFLLSFALMGQSWPQPPPDGDGDLAIDAEDNCLGSPTSGYAPNNQHDADLDGYGNGCDVDFDNDLEYTQADLDTFLDKYGCDHESACWDDDARLTDLDSDGDVDDDDWDRLVAIVSDAISNGTYPDVDPALSGLPCKGQPNCALQPPVPHETTTLAIVQVIDADYDAGEDGSYDQADIDAALEACAQAGGCRLILLPEVYEGHIRIGPGLEGDENLDDGVSIYGYGYDRTVLRSPIFTQTNWDAAISLGTGAPSKVQIQRMTLDGRKREQSPPLASCSEVIRPADLQLPPAEQPCDPTDPALEWLDTQEASRHIGVWAKSQATGPDYYFYEDVLVSHLLIENFAYAGVLMKHAQDWTIQFNWVRHIGCQTWDTPCGDEAASSAEWGAAAPPLYSPGTERQLSGYGISVNGYNRNITIDTNASEFASKYAIAVGVTPNDEFTCEDEEISRYVTISNNATQYSATGYIINGGCDVDFLDNRAQYNWITVDGAGTRSEIYGTAFSCDGLGDGSTWERNLALENFASPYSIKCTGSDLELTDNSAEGNCVGNANGNLASLRFDGEPRNGVYASNISVANFEATDDECHHGLKIGNRDDVTIDGLDISGLFTEAIEVSESKRVEVANSEIEARHADPGDAIAVTFTAGNGRGEDVYVQETTVFSVENPDPELETETGFGEDVVYAPVGSGSVDDGDTIAFCQLESDPKPAGCL